MTYLEIHKRDSSLSIQGDDIDTSIEEAIELLQKAIKSLQSKPPNETHKNELVFWDSPYRHR